jgi:hypothetical protein
VKWSVEQAKEQADKMGLKPMIMSQPVKAQKIAVEKMSRLVPGGKIPKKGTIRREKLEEEVMQQLFVRRGTPKQAENLMNTSVEDLDDLVCFRELFEMKFPLFS